MRNAFVVTCFRLAKEVQKSDAFVMKLIKLINQLIK